MKLSLLAMVVLVVMMTLVLLQIWGRAQTDEWWKEAEKAKQDGLPQTAAEILQQIYRAAVEAGHYGEALRAVAEKVVLESVVQGNQPAERIRRLQAAIDQAPPAMKPLMRLIQARWYWHYFERNRWRFMQRSRTAGPVDEDFTTWDLPRLFGQIDILYQDVLQQKGFLRQLPLTDFRATLEDVEPLGRLRPTVYDFAAWEALAFYTSAEQAAAQPADAFEIDAESPALAPVKEFLAWSPETTDAGSPKRRAVHLYQELLRFHAGDEQPDAFRDADLARLRYAKDVAVGENARIRYMQRMKELAVAYPVTELNALAQFYLAEAMFQGDDYQTAYHAAREGRDMAPESRGGQNCAALISRILDKEYDVTAEGSLLPQRPGQVKVACRNVERLHFRVVRDDIRQFLKGDRRGNPNYLPQEEVAARLRRKPVQEWSAALPPTEDYRTREHLVTVPALAPGYYVLMVSHRADFSPHENKIQYCRVWVSGLALVTRGRNGTWEGFVVDAAAGTPRNGVTVELYEFEYRHRAYRQQAAVVTDADGFFCFPEMGGGYNHYLLVHEPAGDMLGESRLTGSSAVERKPYARTVFFTDRALYRPGQMIHFKGICLAVDEAEDNYEVIRRQQVTVFLRDVNNEEVGRLNLLSNDFGSFSGTFTAPAGRLTGAMTLTCTQPEGRAVVRVEEYKRPRFEVELNKPETEYRLNDEIELDGEALAYTGAPVDGATVVYRVFREVRLPPWCWWYRPPAGGGAQELAHGTAATDADGRFAIRFPARPDRSVPRDSQPIFTFRVQADVTDATGETRSAETRVRLGYTAITADLRLDEWQTVERPVNVTVAVSTLNGQAVANQGIMAVYALEGPDQPVRADLMGESLVGRAGSDGEGPLQLRETAQWERWPDGRRVTEAPYLFSVAEGAGPTELSFALPAGAYRLVLRTRDAFGAAVEARRHIMVVDPAATAFPVAVPRYYAVRAAQVEVGNEFEAVWGTGYGQGPVLVEYLRDGEVLARVWQPAERTQVTLRRPVDESLRGGFTVVTTFVKENRHYSSQTRVNVPWTNKSLDLQWQTFRSKLRPGEAETWALRITGADATVRAAEMVATLYDESLDQFYPHHFQSLRYIFRHDRTSLRDMFSNGAVGLSSYVDNLDELIGYAADDYPRFPDMMVRDLFGYGYPDDILVMSKSMERSEGAIPPPAPAESAPPPPPSPLNGRNGEKVEEPEERAPTPPAVDLSQVQARKNLDETAFFYPHLTTDAAGGVTLTFTMPEALTRWHFLGFAHTRELESGAIEAHTVTQKELMVQPNAPRFLREGDELAFTVKITNMQDQPARGQARLTFFDPVTERPLDAALGLDAAPQPFDVPARQSQTLSWRITVPDGLTAAAYRAVAATPEFSDGEEGVVPVLSRRILVQEALPLWISGAGEKEFRFEKLLDAAVSDTLRHQSLTVQMTSNPAWYAVQALPYLMEFPYECSEQVFNRIYANALARHIAGSDPKIRAVFEAWRGAEALDSPLEKNEDLKSVLLEESPWVRAAVSEREARQRVGLLFEANTVGGELRRALFTLEQMQYPDGSWPWFPGGRGNPYITLYITCGFARLAHLGVADVPRRPAEKALNYLDGWIAEIHADLKKKELLEKNNLTPLVALYLYTRSFFIDDHPVSRRQREAVLYFLDQADEHWLQLANRQSQAHLALGLQRFDRPDTPAKIMRSLKERSVVDEELGRFWRDQEYSWWWYRAPIESQALMIEAFREVARDQAAVEECQVWLLKQKQTQDWKTTKATADAVYALLLQGTRMLASTELVEVRLGGEKVSPDRAEAGTGFYEQRFGAAEIRPAMGRISVTKKDPGIAWGGVHWQYLEDIARITPHQQNPLRLTKAIYVRRLTDAGPVIEPLSGPLAVGDEVVVRVELRTDRDMEYVHLKDHRGSGLEPVNVLSGYRFQDGLAYYESTRDTASHFFIEYLPKGTYVFEYSLRVVHRGRYQSGMAHIECMYAPEFNSHSASVALMVE
ncbi:MAG: hypothetical protein JXQ27_12440 [Acidobacteria bacterium]|nr:hypothetical protein [Acidobacteriota bacterium]